MEDSEEVIRNYTEEFYNNSYPIIGIESSNPGGNVYLGTLLQQFIQVKIFARFQGSFKHSNPLKKMESNTYDTETCEELKILK